jgi:hypothetical protein
MNIEANTGATMLNALDSLTVSLGKITSETTSLIFIKKI